MKYLSTLFWHTSNLHIFRGVKEGWNNIPNENPRLDKMANRLYLLAFIKFSFFKAEIDRGLTGETLMGYAFR